ncbi:hypothetical protein [Spiroplasma sp. SV19]|uniref:hypothetical protein n=1 Tax=Spiroplasma sp. SV19 TaxID=2570468 RepID=UPI0024B78928|nr:hypothetical protein [Spiroplasma sp. SV19]WHQ37195.1 hypothetical protein E7Y35_04810 [Spiroplasma sp. SV19]
MTYNKKKTTSYYHLNEKYDLNFSDYNFGFDWEVFKDFVPDVYARYFTSSCFFKFVSAGRGTHKTWVHIGYKFFLGCNFFDTSSNILRRYANTHDDTTFGDAINVCNFLYDKYGIDLGPDNENGIEWPKNLKEGGEIIFPSGVRIAFAGYANGNKIMGKVGKGTGILSAWTDEMIHAEEKEILTDKELDKRYNNLRISMFRSKSLKVSYEKYIDENGVEQYDLDSPIPIKEWEWTFKEWDFIKQEYVTVTTYFHKTYSNEFTFNPFDKYHIFYKKFVTPFLPLNDRIKKILKDKNQIYSENKQAFNGLGIFNLRLTMGAVWNSIPQITKKLVLANKEERPDLYELEYYGFEYNDSDPSIYVLRNYRKYIKEFDLENFYNTETKQYEFNFYSIGIDYANGSEDDTVFLLSGYQLNEDGTYNKYLIEEKVETPENRINLSTTIEYFGQWIIDCFDKFDGFEDSTFHYDINGHDFMQTLQSELYKYIGYKIKMFKAIKHKSTLNKDAGLNNRVTWLRKMFSQNKVYGNLESLPHLDQCLSELKFGDNNTNIPDPKMYQDPYDALFYGSYPYRYKLF